MTTQIYSTWFKNNNDEFIINVDNKLDWNNGSNIFSSFIYSDDVAKNIIKDKSSLLFGLSFSFKGLDLTKYSIKIIDGENTAYTTGETIYIGYDLKGSYNFINNNDKLDIYLGLLLHEICHCQFTNFNIVNNRNNKLINYIQNILEDEVIERKFTLNYPGYGRYLGKLKTFMFDNIKMFDDINNDVLGVNDLDKILTLFFYIIRYPKYLYKLDYNKISKYDDLFLKIKEVVEILCVNKINNNDVTQNTNNAANKIYNFIIEFLGLDNFEDNVSCLNDKSTFDNINKTITKVGSSNNFNDTYEFNISSIYTKKPVTIDSFNKDNECEYVLNENLNIIRNPKYNIYYNSIYNYIDKVKKILIEKNDNKKSYNIQNFKRSGTLDSSRLVSGLLGNDLIYKRINYNKTNKKNYKKLHIALLLDNSFSMINYKIDSTKIAILLYEGLKNIDNIELSIFGHSENFSEYLTKTKNNIYNIADRCIYGGQNELISYKLAANYLIENKKENEIGLVLNITDSIYLSNYNSIANLINSYKLDNINFGLVTLAESNSINEKLYNTNYTNYNGNFNDMITNIAMNIKNLLKK